MLFTPRLERGITHRFHISPASPALPAVRLLAASLAVEAALWPLLALHLSQVSLISPLANLVILPLASPLIPLGLFQALVGILHPPLGQVTGYAVSGLTEIVTGLVTGLSGFPGAARDLSAPHPLLIGAYYAGILYWARPWALISRAGAPPAEEEALSFPPSRLRYVRLSLSSPRYAVSALSLGLAFVLARGFFSPSGPLRITMIDVGQGDCLLVQAPDGAAMLVDGGGLRGYGEDPAAAFDVGERIVVPYLRRAGVRRLDAVVLTHPHDDHSGGLGAVAERIPVRLVMENGGRGESAAYARFARAVEARRIPRRDVWAGDSFRLGREVTVDVLAPSAPRFAGTRSDPNNNSVALRLRYRGFVALLTGDIEREAEDRLLPRIGPIDLLKVAHHGSESSTTEAFARRARPRVALIGVGLENRFGHPDPDVVRRLERCGARVYRTDLDGAITVETDGDRIEVNSFLRP